ncbi:MAG: InlB B-repeat-containing protein [Spirochaetota bacterium]
MRRFNAAQRATLAITLLLFFSAACSKGSDSGGGGSTPPAGGGSTSAPVTKTQVIGIEGGEIVADDGSWKLTVPALALRFPQEISVTSGATPVGTVGSEYLKFSKAFKFEPHGLFFEQPASFWFKYEQGDMPEGGLQEKMMGFRYVYDDSGIENTRSTVNTALNESTSQLQHFSFGFVMTVQILLVNNGVITNVNPVQNIANAVIAHFAGLTTNPTPLEEYQAYQTMLDAFIAKTEQILGFNPLFQAFPSLFPPGTTGGYSVVYNANGAESGTAPTDSNIYATGNNATVLGNTGSLTRAYHTFAGWNTAADGSGTLYVVGASLAIASANVVLHAQWVEDAKYTITYHANTSTGGSVPVDAGQYYAGMSVIVAANTGGLYKAGSTFVCWNTQADGGGVDYLPLTAVNLGSGNLQLYAKWTGHFTKLYGVSGAETMAGPTVRDKFGNLFVTGHTTGNFGGETKTGIRDIFLTKLAPDGLQLWTKLIGIPATQHFWGMPALDSQGNVYLSGYIMGDLHGQARTGIIDTFLIKYNSSGQRLWTRLYGSPGAYTYGWSIAINNADQVILTGQTTGNFYGETKTGSTDGFLLQVDPEGNVLWSRLTGVIAAETVGWHISIDASGSIFLAGRTKGNLHGQTRIGQTDFFASRYDSAGNRLWTRLVGAPYANAIPSSTAIDSSGSFYIFGHYDMEFDGTNVVDYEDYALLKFQPSGNLEWQSQGATHKTVGGQVRIDAADKIFVIGVSKANLHDQVLTGLQDIFMMRFDTNGNRFYTRFMGSSGTRAHGGGLASDLAGGFYAVGHVNGNFDGQILVGTSSMLVTTKFSDVAPAANSLIYQGNGSTLGTVPVDSNIYVHGAEVQTRQNSGNLQRLNFNFEMWNTMADGSGTRRMPGSKFSMGPAAQTLHAQWRPQWTRLSGTPSAYSAANGVAIDANDNVYSTGTAQTGLHGETMPGQLGYFLMKHDKLGNRAWTRLGGTTNGWNATRAVAVAVSSTGGSIFVTGQTQSSLDGVGSGDRSVAFLTSYSPDGNRNWTRIVGEAPAYATAVSVAADSAGGVYLLASVNGDLAGSSRVGFEDAVLMRYDQYSAHLWTRRIGLAGHTVRAMHIAADADQIYVVGRTNANLEGNVVTGYHDAFIARLDGTGNLNWVKLLGFPASTTEFTAVARKDCGSFVQVVGTTNADIPGPQMMYNRARHSLGFVRTYLTTGQALYTTNSSWPLLPYHVLDASNQISARSIACYGGRAYALFDVGNPYYSYGTGAMSLIGTRTAVLFSPSHYQNRRYVPFGQAGIATYGFGGAFDSYGVYHMVGMTTGSLDSQVLAGQMDAVLSTRLSR